MGSSREEKIICLFAQGLLRKNNRFTSLGRFFFFFLKDLAPARWRDGAGDGIVWFGPFCRCQATGSRRREWTASPLATVATEPNNGGHSAPGPLALALAAAPGAGRAGGRLGGFNCSFACLPPVQPSPPHTTLVRACSWQQVDSEVPREHPQSDTHPRCTSLWDLF